MKKRTHLVICMKKKNIQEACCYFQDCVFIRHCSRQLMGPCSCAASAVCVNSLLGYVQCGQAGWPGSLGSLSAVSVCVDDVIQQLRPNHTEQSSIVCHSANVQIMC